MERLDVTTPKPPLVIDLDGTLTPTDTLMESVIQLVKQSPLNLLRLLLWLPRGRAALKGLVAANSTLSPQFLPYRLTLLDYLRSEKNTGRRLVLATASHKTVADAISKHIGIFDDVIATEATNLKGNNKLEAIRSTLGNDFVYAGDSIADIPIWKNARAAILVATAPSTRRLARALVPIEVEFPRNQPQFRTWAHALRIHQWLKNLLLLVPMLTAFSFLDITKFPTALIAFLAFSLVASATYVMNDLWDLDSDRAHPRKRLRPLASGEVSILSALAASASCLIAGLGLAWTISLDFLMMLILYLLATSSYTWVFKRYVLIDAILLSLLYTLRILAGSIAIEVTTSTWLLAFSVFLFLSLALVKRCSELVSLDKVGGTASSGRDYRVGDLIVLWPLGVATAISSVLVFGLFISSSETAERYASPPLLWVVALGLIYWLSRLWLKTARGEMHDDPVIYAIKDRASRTVVILMTATMIAAHYLELGVAP